MSSDGGAALGKHSVLRPGNQLMLQERDRLVARALREHGLTDLPGLRVFEAGCGEGRNLRELMQWGARAENLAGVDVSEELVAEGRLRTPNLRLSARDASDVEEGDDTYDLGLAFTLFSSVPDDAIAAGIARELLRVVRPSGLILVYDMRRPSPNRDVHRIAEDDIRRWFAGCGIERRTLTVAPPIARSRLGRSAAAYELFRLLPPLRTHALHAIVPPAG